jgi:hypothetical protein
MVRVTILFYFGEKWAAVLYNDIQYTVAKDDLQDVEGDYAYIDLVNLIKSRK